MKKNRFVIYLIFSFIIFGACIYLIPKLFDKINYGLDLQGGFEVLYEVSPLEGEKLDSDMVYSTYKSILKRIDILGVSEPEITIEGENRIRVKLAGVKDPEEARTQLSTVATLSSELVQTTDSPSSNLILEVRLVVLSIKTICVPVIEIVLFSFSALTLKKIFDSYSL